MDSRELEKKIRCFQKEEHLYELVTDYDKNDEDDSSFYPAPTNRDSTTSVDFFMLLSPHTYFDLHYETEKIFTYVKVLVRDSNLWLPGAIIQEQCFELLSKTKGWSEYAVCPGGQVCDIVKVKNSQMLKGTFQEANLRNVDYLSDGKSKKKPQPAMTYITTMTDPSNRLEELIKLLLNLGEFKLLRSPLKFILPNFQGISTPFYYFSTRGSVTPLHVEESLLNSVNLLLSGLVSWLFIHPEDSNKIRDLANNAKFGRWTTHGKEESCFDATYHKNLFFNQAKLIKHRIRHKYVLQRPGEAIFVGSAIYHQVLNLQNSIKVAFASLSTQWFKLDDKNIKYSSDVCQCDEDTVFSPEIIGALKHAYLVDSCDPRNVHLLYNERKEHAAKIDRTINIQNAGGIADENNVLQVLSKKAKNIVTENVSTNPSSSRSRDGQTISIQFNSPETTSTETQTDNFDNGNESMGSMEITENVDEENGNRLRDNPPESGFSSNLQNQLCIEEHVHISSNLNRSASSEVNQVQQHPIQQNALVRIKRCVICGKDFSAQLFQYHIASKHTHVCKLDQCGQSFTTSTKLLKHQKTVHSNHVFRCLICGNTLSSKAAWRTHVKKGCAPKICDICGKTNFRSTSALKYHKVGCRSSNSADQAKSWNGNV